MAGVLAQPKSLKEKRNSQMMLALVLITVRKCYNLEST